MKFYETLCRDSPVQKDWKVNFGDKYAMNSGIIDLIDDNDISDDHDYSVIFHEMRTWLPSQEQWQEMYCDKKKCCADEFELAYYCATRNTRSRYYNPDYAHFGGGEFSILIKTCAFVHKEVYGLTWDWDKNVWVKEWTQHL